MSSVNSEDEELSEEEAALTEESCPFAVTAYENTDKPNVKVCVLFHVGGVSCNELKSMHLCPLPEAGASKELAKA